jgi:hypothetical protein
LKAEDGIHLSCLLLSDQCPHLGNEDPLEKQDGRLPHLLIDRVGLILRAIHYHIPNGLLPNLTCLTKVLPPGQQSAEVQILLDKVLEVVFDYGLLKVVHIRLEPKLSLENH